MMNETFEPGGSARANGKHGLVEALGEYPSWTLWCLAAKTPGDDVKAHEPARSRQVRNVPEIAAVDTT